MPWKNKEDKRVYDRKWRANSRLARRKRIYDRDGGKCTYCHKLLTLAKATLDHFVSRFNGGGEEDSNLRLACFKCNRHKYKRNGDEYTEAFGDDYARLRQQDEQREVRENGY